LAADFSSQLGALQGLVDSPCYEAPQPGEFGAAGKNWEKVGWRGDVTWTECDRSMLPKDHIEQIRPLLPEKYSPLQQDGESLTVARV
jgi:hypothetical protein